jgi:lipopolysaccharide/colanic/teichoic acid biosynthesis glycosyltransferase
MKDTIRILDCTFSIVCLLIISPFLLLIAMAVKLTSKGPVFYKQVRVGKGGDDFKLYKFRTMQVDADKKGLLTVGGRDNRITSVGYYLRKFKLDELPQVLNVLKGDMSLVGPRPEVRRYVDLYDLEQRKVLNVLPGITDYASIAYRNENELLAAASNPEEFYVTDIMPRKIELNYRFITNRSIAEYFHIIFKTVLVSVKGR